MAVKHDIHLSAYKISKKTIKIFENFGFQRDEFANNTRCEVTAYHGTYRGKDLLPNTKLWNNLCRILENDISFSGGLEEEEFDSDKIFYFAGVGKEDKPLLPTMTTGQPGPNIYKACDIHINVNLENSDPGCLKYLEALKVASFDKAKEGKIHRIYTITTETLEDGQRAFSILSEYLKDIKGLIGKMKLEKTSRFLRRPSTAYSLPLTNKESFKNWLNITQHLMRHKRKLFIGSSMEALNIANHVKEAIEKSSLPNIEVEVWKNTKWENLKSALESLNKNIDEYYYAIFIGYPDDILKERESEFDSTRDNTIFEFGLFLSRLGSERTFYLRPKQNYGINKFKVLSDIGENAFVHFYELEEAAGKPIFKAFDPSPLIRLLHAEEIKIQAIEEAPENKLQQKAMQIKSELLEGNKNDEYYINKLRSGIGDIFYAKNHATGINIQEIAIDTLTAITDIKDFCKPEQLAKKQSHTNGIRHVWVFSSRPLEFLSENGEHIKKIKEAVLENLNNDVKYTYFVASDFKIASVNNLISPESQLRKLIEIFFIESKYFKTFFTIHFKENFRLDSLYMTSLLAHRNDLMIQITDNSHIERIVERIKKLKGIPAITDNINTVYFTVNENG